MSEKGHGARWSIAAIDDMIGVVGNFERVARTVQWAAINRDSSRHRDRVDDGWWQLFDKGRSDVTAKFDGVAERRRE